MVTPITPGMHMYYVHRPKKAQRRSKAANWFRHVTSEDSFVYQTVGSFDWCEHRVTVFTEDEAKATRWGDSTKIPFVDNKEAARVVCATSDFEWCWVYAGTVWSLDE